MDIAQAASLFIAIQDHHHTRGTLFRLGSNRGDRPAVDNVLGAGDGRSARGDEEGDQVRHFSWLGGPPKGNATQRIHDDLFAAFVVSARVSRKLQRFSDLERLIPAISQKMLIQQLRQMETDGVVRRIVHHQVPPKVEYGLTDWGQALCPALDALLTWAALRENSAEVGPTGD